MRTSAVVLSVLLLAGCASQPLLPVPDQLFADDRFQPPGEPANGEALFAFSPAMQRYFDEQIVPTVKAKGPRQGLFAALRNELRLEYDATMTRNAAQAFEAHAGNCLSLVIMTAAFAKQLGIPVRYQSVYGYDTWSRGEDMLFLSGHINIGLEATGRDRKHDGDESVMTIDFLPPEDLRAQYSRVVSEATLLAMYLNNRAAETLAQQQPDQAYWWARAAIVAAPEYLAAYNTLGVIYLRHGDAGRAEQTLRYALLREPDNPQVLSNLADLLAAQGRPAEAGPLRARLARISSEPPYYFFDQGLIALKNQEFRQARALFRKELARMPYAHEIHFALALTHLQLGEATLARKELRLALDNSTTRRSHDIYAAKLDHLRELRLN